MHLYMLALAFTGRMFEYTKSFPAQHIRRIAGETKLFPSQQNGDGLKRNIICKN